MSVTPDTLSFIQQAGQSIDAARQALVEAVAQQGKVVASAVVEQPFGAVNDKLFAQWKTLARLAQEVQSIEDQFKAIYETAVGLKACDIQVLVALPHVLGKDPPAPISSMMSRSKTWLSGAKASRRRQSEKCQGQGGHLAADSRWQSCQGAGFL